MPFLFEVIYVVSMTVPFRNYLLNALLTFAPSLLRIAMSSTWKFSISLSVWLRLDKTAPDLGSAQAHQLLLVLLAINLLPRSFQVIFPRSKPLAEPPNLYVFQSDSERISFYFISAFFLIEKLLSKESSSSITESTGYTFMTASLLRMHYLRIFQ